MYEKFPTPLINRLEKHFVLTSSILEPWQESLLKKFKEWINKFSDTGRYICMYVRYRSNTSSSTFPVMSTNLFLLVIIHAVSDGSFKLLRAFSLLALCLPAGHSQECFWEEGELRFDIRTYIKRVFNKDLSRGKLHIQGPLITCYSTYVHML